MKKKQRCLLKRFSALVAALMLCAALCVPCFASNNASTQKWVVVGEANYANEMGTQSRYLHLSPYSNGELYRTMFQTQCASTQSESGYYDWWAFPQNYPDVWRSPIPLGARAYIQIDSPLLHSFSRTSGSSTSFSDSSSSVNLQFLLYDSSHAFNIAKSYTSSALTLSQDVLLYPVYTYAKGELTTGSSSSSTYSPSGLIFKGVTTSQNSRSATQSVDSFTQLVMGFPQFDSSSNTALSFSLYPLPTLYNASSDSLVLFINVPSFNTFNTGGKYRISVSAVVSYWVDANKLPVGLQVGDEFPANTDAFDSLRDELLEQFPEASENIENGKSTLTGWNDTETVDTDVASTAVSALNAMFQNLGSFLFIISLMVFGAVVLRVFIKKAVDG